MLEDAVVAAAALRGALEEEIERARDAREAFRALDSDRILAGATARAAFQATVARRERELAAALARAAEALGLDEVTLARIGERAPRDAARLADELAGVRALAARLAELDRLHLALAGRALAVVQGYLTALAPPPTAYDRRGARTGSAAGAATSGRGLKA